VRSEKRILDRRQRSGLGLGSLAAALFLITADAQSAENPANMVPDSSVTVAVERQDSVWMETPARRRIIVSLLDRKLMLPEDGRLLKVYPVAVGSRKTPSPVGQFKVVSRVTSPTWYHEGKVIAPGRSNPVGSRWIGLSLKGYGIHGTNAPSSIGHAVSHGCIRMRRSDLEHLFEAVRPGDPVEIQAETDGHFAKVLNSRQQGTAGSPPEATATRQQVTAPEARTAVADDQPETAVAGGAW
jgi:hypothetical protein